MWLKTPWYLFGKQKSSKTDQPGEDNIQVHPETNVSLIPENNIATERLLVQAKQLIEVFYQVVCAKMTLMQIKN